MKKLVIFASGAGSNAQKIIEYFKNNSSISVSEIFTNKPHAKVVEIAKMFQIKVEVFSNEDLNSGLVNQKLLKINPDLIVLAGFLLKIPSSLVQLFPNKIINIHPALLPKYGGKGMYGMHVHQAVFENKETKTGITIHYVNENYDEGKYIFQKQVDISDCNSPEEVALKVLELEHQYFAKTIENLLNQ